MEIRWRLTSSMIYKINRLLLKDFPTTLKKHRRKFLPRVYQSVVQHASKQVNKLELGFKIMMRRRLNLPILVLLIFGAASFPVCGQIEVDISSTKSEYLLYEPIDIKVKLTNISSEPLDMARMAKEESWLNFY